MNYNKYYIINSAFSLKNQHVINYYTYVYIFIKYKKNHYLLFTCTYVYIFSYLVSCYDIFT